jgi:hypothetical protein
MPNHFSVRRWVVRAPATTAGRRAAGRFARIARNDLRYALDDVIGHVKMSATDAHIREDIVLRLGWDGRGRGSDRAIARDAACYLAPRLAAAAAAARAARKRVLADARSPAGAEPASYVYARQLRDLLSASGQSCAGSSHEEDKWDFQALTASIRRLARRRLDAFAPLVAVAATLIESPLKNGSAVVSWPEICAALPRPRYADPAELAKSVVALVAGAERRGALIAAAAARRRAMVQVPWIDTGIVERELLRRMTGSAGLAEPRTPPVSEENELISLALAEPRESPSHMCGPIAPTSERHSIQGDDVSVLRSNGKRHSQLAELDLAPAAEAAKSWDQAAASSTNSELGLALRHHATKVQRWAEQAPSFTPSLLEPRDERDVARDDWQEPADTDDQKNGAIAGPLEQRRRAPAGEVGRGPISTSADEVGGLSDLRSDAEQHSWERVRGAFQSAAQQTPPSAKTKTATVSDASGDLGTERFDSAERSSFETPSHGAARSSERQNDDKAPVSVTKGHVTSRTQQGHASAPWVGRGDNPPGQQSASFTLDGSQLPPSGRIDAAARSGWDEKLIERGRARKAKAPDLRWDALGAGIVPPTTQGESRTPISAGADLVVPRSADAEMAWATTEDTGEAVGKVDASIATRLQGLVSATEVELAWRELMEEESVPGEEHLPASSQQPSARIFVPRSSFDAAWWPTPIAGVALAVRPLADLNPGRWLASAPSVEQARGISVQGLVALVLSVVARGADEAIEEAPLSPLIAALSGCAPHFRPVDLMAIWIGEPGSRRRTIVATATEIARGLARGRPAHPPVATGRLMPREPRAQLIQLAEVTLARLAGSLSGFELSSADYIRRQFLHRKGAFLCDAQGWRIALASRPLDLVLRRAGLMDPLRHVPWRPGTTLAFQALADDG